MLLLVRSPARHALMPAGALLEFAPELSILCVETDSTAPVTVGLTMRVWEGPWGAAGGAVVPECVEV